uniref:Ig-like domain-containing protein n=1 Tax=Periophthalmus magnuspinnatus TaxID=409849 RepID=A0A3B3ZCT3_9GOBI
ILVYLLYCDTVWTCCLSSVCADVLQAFVGRDVTITCNYDAKYYGTLSVCWGRGPIPNRGCANEVIRTDGTEVTSRESERYVLFGNIHEGDVSLTIRTLQETDSGTYGCRVDIPGWFNDHKHETVLNVLPGKERDCPERETGKERDCPECETGKEQDCPERETGKERDCPERETGKERDCPECETVLNVRLS